MITRLEWDSKFFDLRIGKIVVTSQREMDELLVRQNELQKQYDLIYIFCQDELVTNRSNVKLVDTKVVYSAIVRPSKSTRDKHIVDFPSSIVTDELVNLALESGRYSRFKLDENFPSNAYERLYTCWIDQSVERNIATEVFCYMIDGHPKGLLTLNRKNEVGDIGLVATDPECRGIGIGSAMVQYAKHYFFTKGGIKINVATQNDNKAACHLYEKSGFTVSSCTNVMHWWLNKRCEKTQ